MNFSTFGFSTPWALLLLLAIPLLLIIAWPRRALHRRARETASLVLRSLIVALIVLALAGISQVQQSDKLATIFLLDVSDSMGQPGREAGLTFIRQALSQMGRDDQAGVILFGADALVERPLSAGSSLAEPNSVPVASYTDIAGAIRLGLTLFPGDAARRMIILSDGGANVGDARQTTQLAQANGVELSVVPLRPQAGADVRLESLEAPALLHEGEKFDLTVKLQSDEAKQVPLQIFSEGRLIAQERLTLPAGDSSFILPLTAGATGFTTFQARIDPPADTFRQNNTLDAFSEVQGPLTVLLVAGQAGEGQPVAAALRGAGLAVQEISPVELPTDLSQISQFKAVVLVNVPASRLVPRQMRLLQTYVRDVGHGLVVIGGEESYGPGGYFQTPLEETLPVDMTIQDQERLPGMTLLLVIDKSGSMEASGTDQWGWGIPRKVELAKEAIYRSLDLLVPWDRVGVIAFDDAARWVVEPTPVTNLAGLKATVGTIRAGGGTDILAGLQLAGQAIVRENSEVRHIILLTDGGANPAGIIELTENLAEQGITTSAVAIGQDYAPFLEDVAKIGQGRFHFADNPEAIPQIFAQETSLASRSYLVEERFQPQVVGASPILQGLTGLPALQGYVATSPKLTAQLILRGGSEQDPLLTQWQYGLGRAVAWTSDAKGQWAMEWINWAGFPRFWSQAVRWTIVESAGGALESQVRLEGDRAVVTAEVLAANGDFRNDLELTLSLIGPDLKQRSLVLPQVAPGLYEGSFRPEQTGSYLLHLAGQDGAELVAAQTRGFIMAYSPEYRTTEIDETLLPGLAEIGGGTVLDLANPAPAFAHTLPPAEGSTPLWPWFLSAAILLLPVDVGLRRIAFGRAELRQLWARLGNQLPQPQTKPAPTKASPVNRLLKIKDKPAPEPLRSFELPATPPAPVQVQPASSQSETEPAPGPAAPGHTVRQLRQRKEQRQQERD
jgi:Mg-chelatase subunit ChlD